MNKNSFNTHYMNKIMYVEKNKLFVRLNLKNYEKHRIASVSILENL